MDSNLLEVTSGVVYTPDGASHEVHGGAYLSPEAYLHTSAELERLRRHHADAQASQLLPTLVVTAGLIGLAAGWLLARRSDED